MSTEQITAELPNMKDLAELSEISAGIQSWFLNEVWTIDVLVQLGALIVALIGSMLFRRFVIPHLKSFIQGTGFSSLVKRILINLARLSKYITALLILMLGTALISGFVPDISTGLLQAASSLLTAWVLIRICLQFIESVAIRNVFALLIWAVAALNILGVMDETTSALDGVGLNVGEFRLSLLTVFKAGFALTILVYGALATARLMDRQLKKMSTLTPSSQVLLSKIGRITLITLAILIGITSAGVDLSLLAVLSGAIGLGIGFGLQKVVSNLFSGLLLLIDRSIQPGDVLELENGVFGWVDHMGARYTEIITRDNKSYLIPNEDFVTQRVVNWSHGSTLIRVNIDFGVDYQHNPHEIIKLAQEAAVKGDRVVASPQPVCHFTGFGDSSLDFRIHFWIRDAEAGVINVKSTVLLALWDAFDANNIKIPYPHRELIFLNDKKQAA